MLGLLDHRTRLQYALLAMISVSSSLLQTLGVASVSVLFAQVMGGKLPEPLSTNLSWLDTTELALCVMTFTLLGTSSSAFATYWGIKLSWSQYHQIASRLLERFLANPYEWHLEQNSASLVKTVIVEANTIVINVLQQLVMICVRGSEAVFILTLLFVAEPWVALATTGTFSAVYGLLFLFRRKTMVAKGAIVVAQNSERQKAANEALGGIKAIKVSENETFFVARFERAARLLGEAQSSLQYMGVMPKYVIEAILFGGLIGFMTLTKVRGWNADDSVTLLALYGAAAIRILPAIQQVYASAAILAGADAALASVCRGLEDGRIEPPRSSADTEGLSENEALRVESISYTYPGSKRAALSDVSFRLAKGEKVGLVGTTGSGKTTLVDVVLGLLPPHEGYVERRQHSDSQVSTLGYVPQHLAFVDDTIAANIALGQEEERRDRTRMFEAAKRACIHDHIVALPDGYDCRLGEQGVKFSGGQRQRIGIARALYRGAELLVLDEASNALDPFTEQKVISALMSDQNLTLLVIAHRISLLKECDRIILLREGRIEAMGPYCDLLNYHQSFAELAKADAGRLTSEGPVKTASV